MVKKKMDIPQSNTPAISLENVTRRYHSGRRLFSKPEQSVTALQDLNLAIERGDIFGLVGESGSGKTTVARLIVRLERPDEGIIRYHHENIAELKGDRLHRFRRRVQMIFQDPYQSLNPYQSVRSTVAEPLRIHHRRYPDQERRTKVMQALAQVGLTPQEDFLGRFPHQLSGGQRQRVAIARAMVLDPDVLIADEPTSMLDASIAVQVYGILAEIQQRRRMAMLLITHSLAAAHFLCNRIAVIYRGHIVETGPTRQVIAHPRHPYTQALLDALPRFGNRWAERRFDTRRQTPRTESAVGGCPFYARCVPADESKCRSSDPRMKSVDQEHKAACFLVD